MRGMQITNAENNKLVNFFFFRFFNKTKKKIIFHNACFFVIKINVLRKNLSGIPSVLASKSLGPYWLPRFSADNKVVNSRQSLYC